MRNVCEERLNAMKIIDKSDVSSKIDGVIKAEMVYVLKNYLDLILDSAIKNFITTHNHIVSYHIYRLHCL